MEGNTLRKEGFKSRLENANRNVNNRSKIANIMMENSLVVMMHQTYQILKYLIY